MSQQLFAGVTGPVIVFDEALFKLTKKAEIEFLPCRVWIGVWTAIIALIVAAFQGSVVVRYFSKFIKDVFVTFVALVFVVEALQQTVGVCLIVSYFDKSRMGKHINISHNIINPRS